MDTVMLLLSWLPLSQLFCHLVVAVGGMCLSGIDTAQRRINIITAQATGTLGFFTLGKVLMSLQEKKGARPLATVLAALLVESMNCVHCSALKYQSGNSSVIAHNQKVGDVRQKVDVGVIITQDADELTTLRNTVALGDGGGKWWEGNRPADERGEPLPKSHSGSLKGQTGVECHCLPEGTETVNFLQMGKPMEEQRDRGWTVGA
ncbi:hypothetical protein EI94DRAFT_1696121 [Lactarius quietus]|nr:hypothetical protein EI94DRAFT_1696121 [Lactarius quietus]